MPSAEKALKISERNQESQIAFGKEFAQKNMDEWINKLSENINKNASAGRTYASIDLNLYNMTYLSKQTVVEEFCNKLREYGYRASSGSIFLASSEVTVVW